MDRRGDLAQSLNDQPAARLRPLARSFGRSFTRFGWPRTARRWFATLIELDPPRGVGSATVAMLMLASVCYGVVKGEHGPDISANVQDLCDGVANAMGFGISEVALSGEHEIDRDEILKTAGITEHTSLLFLDAAQARTRLLTNPWVEEATVLKLYPGRLRIEIKERKAFALWQKEARISLIAADGTILEPGVPARFVDLPLVVGDGAARGSPDFLALMARYPGIAGQIEASVFVAERRWNLHLKNGVEVLLPESEPERALQTLVTLDRDKKLLSRDIVAVDLRLSDRVTVRQSDAAASARADALKAAAKAKKAKGSEA